MELELISALVKSSADIYELMTREKEREMEFRQKRTERKLDTLFSIILCQSKGESSLKESFKAGIEILRREDHSRPNIYAEVWVQRYNDEDFHRLFRMTVQSFKLLLDELRKHPINSTHRRQTVSLEKKTLMGLTYMGTQISLRKIGDQFNAADSTVLQAVDDLCQVLADIAEKYIKWPSEAECQIIAEQFESLAKFPGVIGAIDGCHILAKFPNSIGNMYNNRKQSKSMVLQGICTSKKLLTNVYIGSSGRCHDARVLSRSSISKTIDDHGSNAVLHKQEYHLLGDSAYPLRSWLIVPYKNHGAMTESERKFNTALSKTRVPIENVFGLLKGRWRRLKYIDVNEPKKVALRINAACVLHNFCFLQDDIIQDIVTQNNEDLELGSSCAASGSDNDDYQHGCIKRNAIKEALCSN